MFVGQPDCGRRDSGDDAAHGTDVHDGRPLRDLQGHGPFLRWVRQDLVHVLTFQTPDHDAGPDQAGPDEGLKGAFVQRGLFLAFYT
jgi:hypothetical protein